MKTLPMSPSTLVKAYVSFVKSTLYSAAELSRLIALTVKSVEMLPPHISLHLEPELLDADSLLLLPIGDQELGVRGGLNLEQCGNELLLTLTLDTALLQGKMGRRLEKLEKLLTQAMCSYNAQVRIVMRDPQELGKALGAQGRATRNRVIEG